MNELEYIQCNVYIMQGTTFNIVLLSTVCLSMSIVITTCTECTVHTEHVLQQLVCKYFFRIHSPQVRRQISPPEIFLEHLLQAFYGVDAPVLNIQDTILYIQDSILNIQNKKYLRPCPLRGSKGHGRKYFLSCIFKILS